MNSFFRHIISFFLIFSISVHMSLPVVSRQTPIERSGITLVDHTKSKTNRKQLFRFLSTFLQQGVPFVLAFLKLSKVFDRQVKLQIQAQQVPQFTLAYLAPVRANYTPLYSSEEINSSSYIG